jgi:hypothetical protein
MLTSTYKLKLKIKAKRYKAFEYETIAEKGLLLSWEEALEKMKPIIQEKIKTDTNLQFTLDDFIIEILDIKKI